LKSPILTYSAVGIAGALAFPPFGFWPLAAIYIWFIFRKATSAKTPRQAAGRAFSIAFISGIISYSWLAHPFTFIGQEIVAPIAIAAMAAYLAIFYGIAAAAANAAKNHKAVIFAATFALLEWFRGWFLTGFAWNPIASIFADTPVMLQGLALFGTTGLTALIVYAFTFANKKASAVILLSLAIFGWIRMPAPAYTDTTVRLINIDEQNPLRPNPTNFYRQLSLIASDGHENIDLFVLPESALDTDPTIDPHAEVLLMEAVNETSNIAFGFTRRDFHAEGHKLYNSLGIADRSGIVAIYDKKHLVPFGEYMPLRNIIGWHKFTAGATDFTAGTSSRKIQIGDTAAAPLICYEIIFPQRISRHADYIINISNDAWFGPAGKAQHFALAQLQAVKQGLPVIRSVNAGTSAIIDAHGRPSAKFTYAGFIDLPLPKRQPRTFYSLTGDFFVVPLLFLILLISLTARKKTL